MDNNAVLDNEAIQSLKYSVIVNSKGTVKFVSYKQGLL